MPYRSDNVERTSARPPLAAEAVGPQGTSGSCQFFLHFGDDRCFRGRALTLQMPRQRDGRPLGDVVGGHGETPLMRAAREAGCRTADGDAMVVAVLDVMCDILQDVWT